MSHKKHAGYSSSRIPGLGAAPEHWKENKLKYLAAVQFSNVDKNRVEGERSVRLCNYVDVYYHEHITPDLDFMEATASDRETLRFSLNAGDVLVTKDSESWDDIAIPAYIVSDLKDTLCGYHLAHIRPKAGLVDGRYLLRAFQAHGIEDQFRVAANGITRFGLGKHGLDNALFLVPPMDEQRAIADFLDRETARIDNLIAKKQHQIELLQEKRTAIISHTVTKGLNPDAKMKDSGIEWLGEIPEHWGVVKIKFGVEQIIDCKNRTPEYLEEGEFGVIRTTNVRDGKFNANELLMTDYDNYVEWTKRGRPKQNDVVFTREAPAGEACLIPRSPKMCLGQRVMLFRPGKLLSEARFIAYSVYGPQVRTYTQSSSFGSTVDHLRVDQVRNLIFLAPSPLEQKQIADYLDAQTYEIDDLIALVLESIEKLSEYRSALISAAVTGKIDVRGEAAA